MRKLFFICSLIALCATAFGQDSLKYPRPATLFVSLDYGKLGTLPTEFETKLEAGVGFRIGRHLVPVLYAGISTLTPENAIVNGTYTSEGWYFRTGLEYVMFIDARNSFSVGLRYAQSNFDEEATYVIVSDLFEDITDEVERSGLSARWAEFVIGSEMQLGDSRFYAGGYFTLRIMVDRDEFDPIDTRSIPGYGRTVDKTVPALQLYFKFALLR